MCISFPDVVLKLKKVTSIMHCTCPVKISSQEKLDCSIIQPTQRNKKKPDRSYPRSLGHRGTVVEAVFQYNLKISTTFGVMDCFPLETELITIVTTSNELKNPAK
jgi:hypothetical protein